MMKEGHGQTNHWGALDHAPINIIVCNYYVLGVRGLGYVIYM